MRKHNKIRIFIITISVVLLILPYILVPSLNSDLIWVSPECSCIPQPWCCTGSASFSLPNNNLIQNKYDIIAIGYPHPQNMTFSITFDHLGTGTKYIFNYTLTIAEFYNKTTWTMIPGKYRVYGDLYFPVQYQLWEHGIISPGFEFSGYLLSIIISTPILLTGNIVVHILKMKSQSRDMSQFDKLREQK